MCPAPAEASLMCRNRSNSHGLRSPIPNVHGKEVGPGLWKSNRLPWERNGNIKPNPGLTLHLFPHQGPRDLFQAAEITDTYTGVAGDAGRVPEVEAELGEPVGEFLAIGKGQGR